MNLSYASHYMADLSMPLHTNYATRQVHGYLYSLWDEGHIAHFAYENDYVGANWTTGHNFNQFAKNVDTGFIMNLENGKEM